jgi:hypothetical protein
MIECIVVYANSLGVNPCAINNGGCAHLCLLSNTDQRNYICACHSGTQLHQNGHDCIGKTVALCASMYSSSIIHYYIATGGSITVTPAIQGIIIVML